VLDKNKIIVLFIGMFVCTVSYAQQGVVVSSIGNFGGTTSSISAIQFKSISNCIDVESGMAVLTGKRAAGEFAINCEVSLRYNTLGVRMFPNPVQAQAKVKATNAPPLNETFNLTVWTADGVLLSTRKETGYNLFQGLTIDLSNLKSGTYVLKIDAPKFVDVVKFIKAGN
jgi:hypothetical protein